MNDTRSPHTPGAPVLGCIADDFTGATDLANNLVRAGMRVVLTVDVPLPDERVDADAVVVALKSRTVAAAAAIEQSLRACRWLRKQGAGQIYFKVCSTFDSTAAGNIGPVIEALMEELHCDFSIATPAFPETGRTVVHGHLFVGDTLLSESGMRHHPLTPMTDANLVRVLQAQLDAGKGRRVGLLDYRTVAQSAEVIRRRMDELKAEGFAIAIVDALNNEDLDRLGEALSELAISHCQLRTRRLSLPRNWGFSPSNRVSLPPARGLQSDPCWKLLGGHQYAGAVFHPRRWRGLRVGADAAGSGYRDAKSRACLPGPMPAGGAKRILCSSTRPRSQPK